MDTPQYLNEKAVATRIGLSVATLRAHRHLCKGLPYIKIGRRVLYDPADVREFMQKCRVTPGQPQGQE
jgi:hypothetical protein